MATSRKRDRADRLAKKLALAKRPMLATVAPPTVRQILESESGAPLRGGNKELAHTSLFGDSSRQREMF